MGNGGLYVVIEFHHDVFLVGSENHSMRDHAYLHIFGLGYDRKCGVQKRLLRSERDAIAVLVHYQHLARE
jgi:hypothetical protein